jgi:hypothetical protein
LGHDLHQDMTLVEYYGLKLGNRPREPQRGGQKQQQGHNMDFIRRVGKLTISSFDESSKCTARAWVQKLDKYYKLNQMTKTEAISFATLHLEGEAHECWHHGLVTLCHSHITSYREFTERIMDRFDRRDQEIHFRDLAQLRIFRHGDVAYAVECLITTQRDSDSQQQYQTEIGTLLGQHQQVFGSIPLGRPPDRGFEHTIELEEGAKLMITAPYRHPWRFKDEIEKAIKELLAMGHIRPSSSPFASSVVLVLKKDGT